MSTIKVPINEIARLAELTAELVKQGVVMNGNEWVLTFRVDSKLSLQKGLT